MKEQPEHSLLLRWLILTGLIAFSFIVSWHQEIIGRLFQVDRSRISWLIALIYFLATLHCAKRVYAISEQTNLCRKVDAIIKRKPTLALAITGDTVRVNQQTALPACYMTEYISDLYCRNRRVNNAEETNNTGDLIDVYESRLKGPQEIGWFVSDLMLKLGLLGTIIGFIFMLGSVANIADFDVSSMQKVLRHMSDGMATALYTTLAGLVCSSLAAMQYHMLDRHADELVELIRHLTQVHVIPRIS